MPTIAQTPSEDDIMAIPAVSLRDYIEQSIGNAIAKVHVRIDAQEKAIIVALDAVRATNLLHITAHEREHALQKEAQELAVNAMDEKFTAVDRVYGSRFDAIRLAQEKFEATVVARFDQVNGHQSVLSDERLTFARAEIVGTEIKRVEGLVQRVDDEVARRAAGNSERIGTLERSSISLQASIAQLTPILGDIRDLREYRSTAQGKGAVLAVISSAIVALVVSVMAGAVLFAVTR